MCPSDALLQLRLRRATRTDPRQAPLDTPAHDGSYISCRPRIRIDLSPERKRATRLRLGRVMPGGGGRLQRATGERAMTVTAPTISVFCKVEEIVTFARSHGFEVAEEQPQHRLTIFTKADVQINVWLGRRGPTISTILTHPHQGRNALYRRHVSNEDLMRIFNHPRAHLGNGYRTKVDRHP